MVNVGGLPDLLREVRQAVAAHQPELAIKTTADAIMLTGPFVISGGDGPFDSYEVVVMIQEGFPVSEPLVFETGGRIPRIADRHIFPRIGACCLGVWEEWLLSPTKPTFERFLTGIMHDYFVSQTYFETRGEWPFGERSHGLAGIVESYSDLLQVPNDNSTVKSYLILLSQKQVKGHTRCPCGCGERVRNCHKSSLDTLRGRVSPNIAKRMLRAIKPS